MARLIVFWSVIWIIFAAVNHLFRRKHTILALREMGYELCARCGYWLRGLGDDVKNCPECGAQCEPMPLAAPPKDH